MHLILSTKILCCKIRTLVVMVGVIVFLLNTISCKPALLLFQVVLRCYIIILLYIRNKEPPFIVESGILLEQYCVTNWIIRSVRCRKFWTRNQLLSCDEAKVPWLSKPKMWSIISVIFTYLLPGVITCKSQLTPFTVRRSSMFQESSTLQDFLGIKRRDKPRRKAPGS